MPRALVIDDETLVGMLESRGWDCATAPDGMAGLAAIAAAVPDIVFLDMLMPKLDGLRTLPLIRRDHPEVFIVGMSGGSRDETGDLLEAARRLGSDATLDKPFGLAEVKRILAEFEARKSGRAKP